MIPNKIKVGGVEYAVTETPVVIVDSSTEYAGVCHYETHHIELLGTLGKDRKEQTLVHEMIHAALFESGLLEHDEDLVKRLGITMHQILKDNDFSCFYRGKNEVQLNMGEIVGVQFNRRLREQQQKEIQALFAEKPTDLDRQL